jgi:hypothetical protein
VEFSVEYEHRATGKLDRLAVINAFVDHIPKPPHKVNLSKPHKSILVNVTRNVGCCMPRASAGAAPLWHAVRLSLALALACPAWRLEQVRPRGLGQGLPQVLGLWRVC